MRAGLFWCWRRAKDWQHKPSTFFRCFDIGFNLPLTRKIGSCQQWPWKLVGPVSQITWTVPANWLVCAFRWRTVTCRPELKCKAARESRRVLAFLGWQSASFHLGPRLVAARVVRILPLQPSSVARFESISVLGRSGNEALQLLLTSETVEETPMHPELWSCQP